MKLMEQKYRERQYLITLKTSYQLYQAFLLKLTSLKGFDVVFFHIKAYFSSLKCIKKCYSTLCSIKKG